MILDQEWVRGHDILRALAECIILQEVNTFTHIQYLSGTFYWRYVFEGKWKAYGQTYPLPSFSTINRYRSYTNTNIPDNYSESLLHDFNHLPVRVKNMLKREYGIEMLNNEINNFKKLTKIHMPSSDLNSKNFGRKSVHELKKFLNKYGFDYLHG
jgi:hypothetical protein